MSMNDFLSLGLESSLCDALSKLGYLAPTHPQKLAIPEILAGKDIFLQSETGTGKTIAYAAPILTKIAGKSSSAGPLALILTPTQELAVQVERKIEELAQLSGKPISIFALLGGSPISRQEATLKKKPHIVVGTPGRTADLVTMRALSLKNLAFFVLDEADRLFSQEYRDEVETLLARAPEESIKILASATIDKKTRAAAREFMKHPVSLDLLEEGVLSADIEHWAFYVEHRKRIDFLRKLETAVRPSRCLVFASSSERVVKAGERMQEMGLPAAYLISKQDKEEKRVAIERFTTGSLRYLVTTDLGARGLDIPDISHIISLDVPEDASIYIHRAGRTARAGKKGVSIILADQIDLSKASRIAVMRGFVFRTKMLANAQVLEPTTEEFFAYVEEAEKERREYRKNRGLKG